MLRDQLEFVLYELTSDRSARKAFTQDPDAQLARYRIDDTARQYIKDFDVRALMDAGVNAMLIWGLWLVHGRGDADAYLARLNERETSA